MYLRQYLDEAKRSSTGRPILSDGYPEPIVSPVGAPLCTFHGALHVSAPTCQSEPVIVYHCLSTGPAQRFHLWFLRGRATPISPDVFLPSLCYTPRQIYRSGCGGGPPVEAELNCGYPGTYGSLLRRIRRSAEILDLLEKGL